MFNTVFTGHPGFDALQEFARNVVGLLTFGDDPPSRPAYNMHFATVVGVNHAGATVVNGAGRMSRHRDVIDTINSLSRFPAQSTGAPLGDVNTAALGDVITGIHATEWRQDNTSANTEVVEVAVVYLSPVDGIAANTCHNFGCGDRTVGAENSCACADPSGGDQTELCGDYASTCLDAAPTLDVDEFSCNTEAQGTLDHFRIRYPRRRVDPSIPRSMQCYFCDEAATSQAGQCAQVCLTYNASACTMFQLHEAWLPREFGNQHDGCPFSECASPEYRESHNVQFCEIFAEVVGTEQLVEDVSADDTTPPVDADNYGTEETEGRGIFGRTNFCGDQSSFYPWGEGRCNPAARGPLGHYQQQLGMAVQAAFGAALDEASAGRDVIVRRNVTTAFDCAIACSQEQGRLPPTSATDDGTDDGVHRWCQMFDFSNAGSTCRLWNDVPEVGNGVLAFTEQDPHSSIFVRTSFCDGEAHATDPASHYGARAVLAVPLIDGAETKKPLLQRNPVVSGNMRVALQDTLFGTGNGVSTPFFGIDMDHADAIVTLAYAQQFTHGRLCNYDSSQ